MKIGLSKIDEFRTFFDVVLEYRDTVELAFGNLGLKVSVLNRSHSSFYEVFYDKDFFDVYDVDGTEVLNVFIEDLYKILKTASKNEYLEFETSDEMINVIFEKDGNTRNFELVQAQIFDETPQKPNIPLTCKFITDMDVLNQTFKDIGVIKTNSVDFVVSENELALKSTEQAMTKYSHKIYIESSDSASARYSIEYLKDIVKFKKISNVVEILIGDDMPLIWTCEGENIMVNGLIAPLMGEE